MFSLLEWNPGTAFLGLISQVIPDFRLLMSVHLSVHHIFIQIAIWNKISAMKRIRNLIFCLNATSNKLQIISIFHAFELRIKISVTRENCVWRVTRLWRVPAKTVIPRGGHFHAHLKTHMDERYFFLHKALISLFSLIFYQIINIFQNCTVPPFVQNNKLFMSWRHIF